MRKTTSAHTYLSIVSWYYLLVYGYIGFTILLNSTLDLFIFGELLEIPVMITLAFSGFIFPPIFIVLEYFDGVMTVSEFSWALTALILVYTLSIIAIILLKRKVYSRNFLRFWFGVTSIFLALSAFNFGIYGSILILAGPLISSILILLAANYLYRQQKNSSITLSNSNTKIN